MTLKYFARLAILISVTFVFQIFGLPQPITGTSVNFMLIFTVQFMGVFAALILGMLTPLAALMIGHLPSIFAVMLPFIIVANWMIIVVFNVVSVKNNDHPKTKIHDFKKIVAVLVAAFCKFIFLAVSVKLLLPVILAYQLNEKIIYMVMFPQLFTALAGGILAVFLYGLLVKNKYFSELLG